MSEFKRTNKQCAEAAERAIRAYLGINGTEPILAAGGNNNDLVALLADLLADLRHWARAMDIEYAYADELASDHHCFELGKWNVGSV